MNHPRKDPCGPSCNVVLPKGVPVEKLKYKQRLTITVDGNEREAVVDLGVSALFGGPRSSLEYFDATGLVRNVYIKIVWMEPGGDWNEARDLRSPSLAEFLVWRSEFVKGVAPTPMPW